MHGKLEPKKTIGMTGLRENLGQDDGIEEAMGDLSNNDGDGYENVT